MSLSSPSGDFAQFGFPDPTPEFVLITTAGDGDGRALIDGVVVIPGLPVCRVRMRTDEGRVHRDGPGRRALVGYVRAALHEDVVAELPWN
ncbi:hypothetical protein RQM47_08025 [Rubrivirga sp. S365]|uniref:Uncharacterized protein n=1 Tax=Rubrivirga litoralis TaxID=3075598 RepID=A0ABU3BNS1_9BACT|nr:MULTISPECIES: hypothetical protein [unclassified Rubrivirga]MDT0630941.1 hypothetical protein [Rubrivirga sp. F394]MDT7856584.1 hypothetical protein [Rubrivirga sp. S365]